MPLAVKGMRELQTALAVADKQVRLGVHKVEREVAEPVRRDVEALTDTRIRNMQPNRRDPGRSWMLMRTGVTRTRVYVAPKQRSVGRGNPAARRNLATLIRVRAMDPAEDRNRDLVRRNFEQMLDTMATRFNRGI